MRGVPPVQALSSAGGSWRLGQCLLWSVAAGGVQFWAACWWVGLGWPATLLGIAAALVAGACAIRVSRVSPRTLIWDGAAWLAVAPGTGAVQGHVQLMIDLGAWLLVRFDADARMQAQGPQALWMPLSRRDNGAVWHGLRTALYAPTDPPAASRAHRFARPNE